LALAGFALDVPVVYHAHSDYWGENETLANGMWEAIDTNPIAVALDNEWAKQHGLPEAGPFPWDNSKGTYFVKAFHQLHCLVRSNSTFLMSSSLMIIQEADTPHHSRVPQWPATTQ
jgi:hypothetical protein